MRRVLPYLLALLLGTSTALLAACGGGGTKGGIPSASAGELKSQITDVGQAVDGGRCDEVPGQLKQVDEGIDALPKTTDTQLVSALREGATRLRREAIDECDPDAGTETTTETIPEETETTETQPTDTLPTDTLPTDTDETPTTSIPEEPPPPTPPAPTPPPAPPTPQPPVNPTPPPAPPGGGVTPEIPPG